MVEEVRMFKTDDGRKFTDYDAALIHEHDAKSAQMITDMLPDNSNLASGDFYQLTRDEVRYSRTAFCVVLRNKYGGDKTFKKAIDAYEDNPLCDLIGRLLCDSNTPFYGVFITFSSINYNNNRLFNQPYYANHPDEAGKQIPID